MPADPADAAAAAADLTVPRVTVPDDVAAAFHRLVGHRPAPMLVVTTWDGLERSGCLVGFATQCSIDPPAFLVCLSDKNHTFGVAHRADHLAVHHLTVEQHHLARLFGERSGDDVDKFADVEWTTGPEGLPILAGVAGWFVGRIERWADLGDHHACVLHPVAAHAPEGPAPALTLDDVTDLVPGHAP